MQGKLDQSILNRPGVELARRNLEAALLLLKALMEQGLSQAVLCPGSRSGALALALGVLEPHGLALYTAMGYPMLKLVATQSVDALRQHLTGQCSVLVGESGMGKSTILNALVPQAAALTREVSASLGTGKHTTSHTRLHHLDTQSDIIDTPGVQAFGVHHLGVDGLAAAFMEFRPWLGQCRFRNCRHLEEPGCAITAAHDEGQINTRRLKVYRSLAQEILRQQKRF